MKKLLPAIFVLSAFLSDAQITITSSNMPSLGDSARVSLPNILSLLDASNTDYQTTGSNYFWDFTNMNTNEQTVRQFIAPPGLFSFYFFPPRFGEKVLDSVPLPAIPVGSLTLVIKDVHNFYKKNSTTSYNNVGTGMMVSGIPLGATAQAGDEDELYKFPLNYGDRDSTTFSFATPTTTLIPFKYKKHGYRITEVDGWGYVSTPYGTEPCIRVVSTQYATDSIIITNPPFSLPFPNVVRTYQWLTLGEKVPYFEVNGSMFGSTFTPTEVRYRDKARSFVGIKENENQQLAVAIYPNPAVNELNFVVAKSKELNIEIYSASGQSVIKKSISNTEVMNKHSIDISKLAQGLYSGSLSDGETVQNFKFIKQ